MDKFDCMPIKLVADMGYDINAFIKNALDGILGCFTCTSPVPTKGEMKAERGEGLPCCGMGGGEGASACCTGRGEEGIGRMAYQEW